MVPLCRAAGSVLQARLASAIGDHRQLDRLWRLLGFFGSKLVLELVLPGSASNLAEGGTALCQAGEACVRCHFLQHLGPKLMRRKPPLNETSLGLLFTAGNPNTGLCFLLQLGDQHDVAESIPP